MRKSEGKVLLSGSVLYCLGQEDLKYRSALKILILSSHVHITFDAHVLPLLYLSRNKQTNKQLHLMSAHVYPTLYLSCSPSISIMPIDQLCTQFILGTVVYSMFYCICTT